MATRKSKVSEIDYYQLQECTIWRIRISDIEKKVKKRSLLLSCKMIITMIIAITKVITLIKVVLMHKDDTTKKLLRWICLFPEDYLGLFSGMHKSSWSFNIYETWFNLTILSILKMIDLSVSYLLFYRKHPVHFSSWLYLQNEKITYVVDIRWYSSITIFEARFYSFVSWKQIYFFKVKWTMWTP